MGWARSWAHGVWVSVIAGLSGPRRGDTALEAPERRLPSGFASASRDPSALTPDSCPSGASRGRSRGLPVRQELGGKVRRTWALVSPRGLAWPPCASGRPPTRAERVRAVTAALPTAGAPLGVALLSLFPGGSSASAALPAVTPDLRPARVPTSLPKAHRPSWSCPGSGWGPPSPAHSRAAGPPRCRVSPCWAVSARSPRAWLHLACSGERPRQLTEAVTGRGVRIAEGVGRWEVGRGAC